MGERSFAMMLGKEIAERKMMMVDDRDGQGIRPVVSDGRRLVLINEEIEVHQQDRMEVVEMGRCGNIRDQERLGGMCGGRKAGQQQQEQQVCERYHHQQFVDDGEMELEGPERDYCGLDVQYGAMMGVEQLEGQVKRMLKKERLYCPVVGYVESVQKDGMQPVWRTRLFEWMLEFVDEFQIGLETVATAMNFVDRYLSRVSTKKTVLQLIALAAILIASKLVETYPIGMKDLQSLAEGIYLESDIRMMELELLQVLSWKLNPATGHCFLSCFVQFLDDFNVREKVTQFAETFLELVLCEYYFHEFLPSECALASFLVALDVCNVELDQVGGGILLNILNDNASFCCQERIVVCKRGLLDIVRQVFPEYFRSQNVISPVCVGDLDDEEQGVAYFQHK